jgi:hypothetical protein
MGTRFRRGKSWEEMVRDDFEQLRKAQIDHPDMVRIESMLSQ